MFRTLFTRKAKPIVLNLSTEQDAFLGSAIQEFNKKRKRVYAKYGFDRYAWFFDQQRMQFQLKSGNKVVHRAQGQIIGSYLKSKGTWEWAWNNPNIPNKLCRDSKLVKHYGIQQNLPYFTDGIMPIGSTKYAEYLTAVGVKLSDSEGAYFGDTGKLIVYIMLKNIQ